VSLKELCRQWKIHDTERDSGFKIKGKEIHTMTQSKMVQHGTGRQETVTGCIRRIWEDCGKGREWRHIVN
jgi:hypothetical protein